MSASAPEWVVPWSLADGAVRVADAFTAAFPGQRPDGVWAAPGRANIIGEHTDYNAGLCLPIALPHRAYVALRRRDDSLIRLRSAQESGGEVQTIDLDDVAPGAVSGWVSYVVGVAWALRQAGHVVGGFDVAVDSCVPYGAGVSSSAALECAIAVGLDEVNGLGLASSDSGRSELAAVCVHAENSIAGAPTGGLDQSASLHCRAGVALLLDFRDGSAHPVSFDVAGHNLALLVIDTRATHQLADGQYAARREVCEAAAAHLGLASLREINDLTAALAGLGTIGDEATAEVARRRVRHVVTENDRVHEVVGMLTRGEVEAVGPVLTAAHTSLRDDYEVSCPELDLAVSAAIGAGAIGARMMGGGFGGSAIALIRATDGDSVASAVTAAFAAAGHRPPAFLMAMPDIPAGRI